MSVRLIVNPNASGVTPAIVERVERALRPRGRVATVVTEARGHATALAREACSDGYGAVLALGGDGTYNEVVNGVRGDVPLGFLPGGGTSVLPRVLGLPRDPVACAGHLATSGATRRISLGRANGRRFTFSCGIGLDAELVRAVDAHGRTNGRRPGDATFVLELARLLAGRRFHLAPRLRVEGHGEAAFAMIANCDPYSFVGPLPLHAAPAADLAGGLDVVAPRTVGPLAAARIVWWGLARPGGQLRRPDVIYVHDVDSLRIVCPEPIAMQLDGEDVGDVTLVELEAERSALTVLV